MKTNGSSPNPVESRVDRDFFAACDFLPGGGLVSTLPSRPAVHPMLAGSPKMTAIGLTAETVFVDEDASLPRKSTKNQTNGGSNG